MNITLYHVMYNVRYYPRFHVTAVGLYIVIYRLITRSYIGSDWTGILFVPVAVQHSYFKPSCTGHT